MSLTIAQKIIKSHLKSGSMEVGKEIGLKIDQTLTQDATGTMAYLQFEALGIERVKTELSVAYIDHNTLQSGFENADDHEYIRSVAKKHGLYFSRPGNGICHQVHLERFGKPGKTLIGSDSHTPTAGGIGMLSFGAGGLDVAVAMGGGEYYIPMPKMVKIELKNALRTNVSAKDIILAVLKILSVKGGVGKIIEYGCEGIKTLSVPERATITNMGTELGATTSIFPSDEITRAFLKAQDREEDYIPLESDADAVYDETYTIDLATLEPLAACPHMPDNVKSVSELGNMKIDQVCIGSCTNSSYDDLMKVAAILKGNTVHETVSLTVSPGSKQVYNMLAQNGGLADIISAGARILECACGPCIGMGQSPKSAGVSLRTFNRNFEGRSGTKDGQVYLVSPETAAYSAIKGVLSNPMENDRAVKVDAVQKFVINDNMIVPPASCEEAEALTVNRGPNIKPFPLAEKMADTLTAPVSLKVGDNITTDHIMPAGSKILPYRSNIPYLSKFCFAVCDEQFAERAKALGSSIIIGGANYGQGSSREHAALVPLYLGIKAVVAKSFARIHAANLINNGILPLAFENSEDYELFEQGDTVVIEDLSQCLSKGSAVLENKTKGVKARLVFEFSSRQQDMLKAGGLINLTRGN